VVIEGLVERKSWGDIAVDDIRILDGVSMAECNGTSGISEMSPGLAERFSRLFVPDALG